MFRPPGLPLCLVACLFAVPASAATVDFTIDFAGSSVAVTDQSSPGAISGLVCDLTDCGVSAVLAPGLSAPLSFSLAGGESTSFDFAVLSSTGIGVPLSFSLAATLGLLAGGESVAASATGSGAAVFAAGFFLPVPGVGGFVFDGQPVGLTLADGTVIEVAFGGFDDLLFGPTATLTATVSVIEAISAVPIPASAATFLAALALLGLVSARRRAFA